MVRLLGTFTVICVVTWALYHSLCRELGTFTTHGAFHCHFYVSAGSPVPTSD